MSLPRWVLAVAGEAGGAGGGDAALGAVTSPPNLDDRALVVEAQVGNRAAFEELVHRYDRDVLRLALNLMKRPEDARDVYQEAFLKVYRNLHRFRFECSFYTCSTASSPTCASIICAAGKRGQRINLRR